MLSTLLPMRANDALRTCDSDVTGRPRPGWRWLPGMLSLLLVASCATDRPAQETPPASQLSLVVLVSDNTPAYTEVARELRRRHQGRIEVVQLQGRGGEDVETMRRIRAAGQVTVAAIGLYAAEIAVRQKERPVVFCQVFNYEDAQLLGPQNRGVSAVASPAEQFRQWKMADRRLRRVAVLTGGRLTEVVSQAREAARAQGVELAHVEVRSDKETVYAYKRLIPTVQGLWLLPDNRVLSRDVIRDLLNHSIREGKSVLVLNSELLTHGALASAESDPVEIADRVIDQARAAGGATAAMAPLARVRFKVNTAAAARLGLVATASTAGSGHAR